MPAGINRAVLQAMTAILGHTPWEPVPIVNRPCERCWSTS